LALGCSLKHVDIDYAVQLPDLKLLSLVHIAIFSLFVLGWHLLNDISGHSGNYYRFISSCVLFQFLFIDFRVRAQEYTRSCTFEVPSRQLCLGSG